MKSDKSQEKNKMAVKKNKLKGKAKKIRENKHQAIKGKKIEGPDTENPGRKMTRTRNNSKSRN